MGTTTNKRKIEILESKMLMLKLRKIKIKHERNERLKQLKKLTGKEIIREEIPDYIVSSEDEDEEEDKITYEKNEIKEDEKDNSINDTYYYSESNRKKNMEISEKFQSSK